MGAIGVVLAAVLAFVFFSGDKERTGLESALSQTKAVYEAKSKKEAEEYEAKVGELQEDKAKLEAEMNERIEEESKKKTELYTLRIKELETKLKSEEGARKAAEEDLDRHKSALAQAGARIKSDGSNGLLFEGGNKNIEALLKETSESAATAKKEKEDAELAIELFQKDIRDKSRTDFKQRASSLESRLLALQQDKKVMEDRWSEAMTAIVRMEETAEKIETELETGKNAAQDAKGPDLSERQAKLQSDMELLKKTREDVRKAMEKIRGAVESSMDAETKMMMSETSQLSESLGKMFAAPVKKPSGVDAASAGTKEKIASLNSMMADLSVIMKETFDEDSYGTPEGELKAIREMAAKLRGRCEEQLKALTGEKLTQEKRTFDIYKNYLVKKGDTLWGISSQKEVYNNPYWWPLLYKYNPSIKNPDIIEPNITLTIQRDPSQKEIDEAINDARRHILLKQKKP